MNAKTTLSLKTAMTTTCAAVAALSPMLARTVVLGAVTVGALASTSKPAHAQLRYGWHDLGNGYTLASMNPSDARAYADLLASTSNFQDRVNKVAQMLIKYGMGNSQALQWARVMCYNGLSLALKARIYWSSWRSNTVYIYHRWSLPFYADPA